MLRTEAFERLGLPESSSTELGGFMGRLGYRFLPINPKIEKRAIDFIKYVKELNPPIFFPRFNLTINFTNGSIAKVNLHLDRGPHRIKETETHQVAAEGREILAHLNSETINPELTSFKKALTGYLLYGRSERIKKRRGTPTSRLKHFLNGRKGPQRKNWRTGWRKRERQIRHTPEV